LKTTKFLCILFATLLLLSPHLQAMPAFGADQASEAIHAEAVVIDTHNDTLMHIPDSATWLPAIDIGGSTSLQLDIPKAAAGGLNAAFFAAFSNHDGNQTVPPHRLNSRTLALLYALHWNAGLNSDEMVIGTSLYEINRGIQDGKLTAVPALEGMYALNEANAIELLNQYYDLGVRCAGIVWNPPNALGAGVAGPDEMGLSELGKAVMREMNRLGIMIDVSHMNEKTFTDTLAVSNTPVIASHSGASGVRPHVRNLTDEQLRAISENGGVVQINFWRSAVANPGETANLSRLVDHIDHVVRLIGADHVGLGSDFDGAPMPAGMENASKLPDLTKELVRRGYHSQDIKKILGGNTLRVLRDAERHADTEPHEVGRAMTIMPYRKMGETMRDAAPLLMAQVTKEKGRVIDEAGFRLIINGAVHEPEYDTRTGLLSFQVVEPLLAGGNYHVVTFEGRTAAGRVTRETLILYVR
jgi:membrane dipeptidase